MYFFRIKVLSAVSGAVLTLFFLFHPVVYLQLSKGKKVCLYQPMGLGGVIHFQTRNSVEGSRWDEYWQVGWDGKLWVVDTVYRDEGAGFPIAPSKGAHFKQTEEGFEIYGMHRIITVPLYVRFDGKRDIVIEVGGKILALKKFGEGLYRLELFRVPWLRTLFGGDVR